MRAPSTFCAAPVWWLPPPMAPAARPLPTPADAGTLTRRCLHAEHDQAASRTPRTQEFGVRAVSVVPTTAPCRRGVAAARPLQKADERRINRELGARHTCKPFATTSIGRPLVAEAVRVHIANQTCVATRAPTCWHIRALARSSVMIFKGLGERKFQEYVL